MATSTVSHHVFRRNARKMERKLERARIQAIADIKMAPNALGHKDEIHELRHKTYRVAQRRGGLRWAVEEVTR